MFSQKEKNDIATRIETQLLALNHPEMPNEKPEFCLLVKGKEAWSYCRIMPNWTFDSANPASVNPWNEIARKVLDNQNG